jgi:uncharacterized protein with PQ loop repeat
MKFIIDLIFASTIPIAIFLQSITMIQNGSSENVSIPSYVLFIVASLSFVACGILRKKWSLIISGGFICATSLMAIISIISFRPSSQPGPFVSF